MPINLRPIDAEHSEFMTQNLDLNPQEDTGFKDNYGAALGMAIDEELSISSVIHSPDFKPRNEELWSLVKQGSLPNHEAFLLESAPTYRKYDWAALARYAQKEGYDIQTDVEIMGKNREELASRRRYAQDIMDRADGAGVAGMVAGYLHGGTVDPVNVGLMVLGPLAFGRYMAGAGSVMRTMAVEGSLGVAGEAAIAPFVHEWKETMGVDYTIDDVLVNMAATGGLNAGLGGLAEWAGQIVRGAKDAGLDTTPLELSREEFQRLADEFGAEADPEEVLRQMDSIEKEMETPTLQGYEVEEISDVEIGDVDRGDLTPVEVEEIEIKDVEAVESELPDTEIYISVEEGFQKVKAKELDEQIDNLIKYIEEQEGVPICGR